MSGIACGLIALIVLALLIAMCFIVYHNSIYDAMSSYVVPSIIDAGLILLLLCVSFCGKTQKPAGRNRNSAT